MKRIIFLVVLVVVLTGCSEYQKVFKSTDPAVKNKMAEALYKEGKYQKAIKLYSQVMPVYRGKPQAERVRYYYADALYKVRDHYLASYQFGEFVKSYPKSDKREEAAFKEAKSFYYLSPTYSLDQSDSEKAINRLQDFINKYPDSEYLKEANQLVAELNNKVERKRYEVAKQFHHMEQYKVAIASFDNFLGDFPGSDFREKTLYFKYDAAYELAINSLDHLVKDRLLAAKKYYDNYMKYYQNEGDFVKNAANSFKDINKRLEQYEL